MFSLIITIVSIALVVALVAAAMFHGGSEALTKGKQEAEITTAISSINQIQSAVMAYTAHTGQAPVTMSDLVPQYLRTPPDTWGVEGVPTSLTGVTAGKLTVGDETQRLESCRIINQRKGLTGEPPSCDAISSTFIGCCVSNP